jgi:hypothetical protein
MFIQRGKPIPAELLPIDHFRLVQLVDTLFPSVASSSLRDKISRLQPEWNYMSADMRINALNLFFEDLFISHCPKPFTRLTFSRVRFTASFHSEDWSMRFSENFFLSNSFDSTFRTWLHEMFHAFLHFCSMRLNPSIAADLLSPPSSILEAARRKPLRQDHSALAEVAKKNLLGILDRSVGQSNQTGQYRAARFGDSIFTPGQSANHSTGTGLDSFYLNVEILVEDLTEIAFRRFFTYTGTRRSYATAQDYIQRRLNGMAPTYAARA